MIYRIKKYAVGLIAALIVFPVVPGVAMPDKQEEVSPQEDLEVIRNEDEIIATRIKAELLLKLNDIRQPPEQFVGANRKTMETIIRAIRTNEIQKAENHWREFVELNRQQLSDGELIGIIDFILQRAFREAIDAFRRISVQVKYYADLEAAMKNYLSELDMNKTELDESDSIRIATTTFRLRYSVNIPPSDIGMIRSFDKSGIEAEIKRVSEQMKVLDRTVESIHLQFNYANQRSENFIDRLQELQSKFRTMAEITTEEIPD